MAEQKSIKDNFKAEKHMLRSVRRYSRASGFMIQPNKKILTVLLRGLLKNIEKYGFRYCPCRKPTKNTEKNKKIICPCAYHKDEIKQDGYCKCLLYYKKIK